MSPIHFHCILHAKGGVGVQKACNKLPTYLMEGPSGKNVFFRKQFLNMVRSVMSYVLSCPCDISTYQLKVGLSVRN